VAGDLLLDTGPLIALLDASEKTHDRCVAVFRDWPGTIVTTEAVYGVKRRLPGREIRGSTARSAAGGGSADALGHALGTNELLVDGG
jgi:hypothetical protein